MIRELAQGVDGLVTIAIHAPGQAVRTIAALPPTEREALTQLVKQRLGLGDDTMSKSYYYNVPQLYKLPPVFTKSPGMGDEFDDPVDYDFTVEEVGPVNPPSKKSSNLYILLGALAVGYLFLKK